MADLLYALWLPILVAVWIIIVEDVPEPKKHNWLESTDVEGRK